MATGTDDGIVSIYMSPETQRLVDEKAKELGKSRSALIEDFVVHCLNSIANAEINDRRKK